MPTPVITTKEVLAEMLAQIPEDVITEMCVLVKGNSIEGSKAAKVDIVYTPFHNLDKRSGMDDGQVGFKEASLRYYVRNVEKNAQILKRIEKTRSDDEKPDFFKEKEQRMEEEKHRRKKAAAQERDRKKEEERKHGGGEAPAEEGRGAGARPEEGGGAQAPGGGGGAGLQPPPVRRGLGAPRRGRVHRAVQGR